jgi:hypothetical protein
MFIVLSNRRGGKARSVLALSGVSRSKHMPDTQNIETTPVAPEQDHEHDLHPASPSRRAAAIEAAYILEAVRK